MFPSSFITKWNDRQDTISFVLFWLFYFLKDIKDAQPDGYYARVPVYLIGNRDANIVLSAADSSAPLFVYEFGIFLFICFQLTELSVQTPLATVKC